MRTLLRALVAGALASLSVVACTFIVDGQFKDYSGTCQIQGIGDNVCGRCVASKCQAKIDAVCTSISATSNLSSCVQNPNPGRDWSCANLIGDAALASSTVSKEQNALNHCVADGCMDPCTTCTSIDAGTGACGTCIMHSCGALLNGNDGCCQDTTVGEGIAKAVAAVNPSCQPFQTIVGAVWAEQDAGAEAGVDAAAHDAGFSSCKHDSPQEFANCVVTNCGSPCACQ